MEKKKAVKMFRTASALLAVSALIAAVILLACTGFAFTDLLRSPAAVTQGADMTPEAYVTADVSFVMDICAVERDGNGEAKAYFAIVPVGDQFVLVRFPADDYDHFASLEAATRSFLRGVSSDMGFHLAVTGMTRQPPNEAAALLAQWFEDNASWMSQSGVIGAVEDYETYLGAVMIDSGTVGSVSYPSAVAMTLIAALLIVFAVVEIVFFCAGRYDLPGKGKDKRHV